MTSGNSGPGRKPAHVAKKEAGRPPTRGPGRPAGGLLRGVRGDRSQVVLFFETRPGETRPGLLQALLLLAAALLPPPVAAEAPEGDAVIVETPIGESDREHWSFQPLTRPAIPRISSPQPQNPIDFFVLARLRPLGLQLQPRASAAALARRLSFDLAGLPPAHDALPEEATALDAARLAERLISSPAYGERWAQHWLDLARFAETDGFEHDKVREQAWKYRDWVIDAWNRGMSYDQFVRQQLAGDLLQDHRALVATMFCTSGPDMPDINSQQERRHDLLNEMTATVGAALLGLQIGCAQCHDHKYDPISQADFYRLRAMFEPALRVQRNRSVGPLLEQPLETPPRLWVRGDWRRPGPELQAAPPRIVHPDGRAVRTRPQLADWLVRPSHPLTARVIVNRLWQHHFGQGLVTTPSDFGIIGDPPTHPQLLDFLASELVDSQWDLQHVQRLIVMSATYQQASLLPLDAAPQLQSQWQAAVEQDPRNQWLSRFPRKRLGGEAVRDAMLAVSGSLDRRMGGPGVRPPLPPEVVRTLLKNQWKESPRGEHYRRSIYVFARRNLRFPIFEVLDRPEANASCPQRSRSTTAPQALLLLNSPLTLDAARRLAGRVLEVAERPDPESWAQAAFRLALSRAPADEELDLAAEYLREHALLLEGRSRDELALPQPGNDAAGPAAAAALTDFCLALLNCNEFLYLD